MVSEGNDRPCPLPLTLVFGSGSACGRDDDLPADRSGGICGTLAVPRLDSLAAALASSGFADTSRVGGGNPDLGVAMASSNRDAVLRVLAAYRWSLEQLEDAVLQENWSQLHVELKRTQALRPDFLQPLGDINAEN